LKSEEFKEFREFESHSLLKIKKLIDVKRFLGGIFICFKIFSNKIP